MLLVLLLVTTAYAQCPVGFNRSPDGSKCIHSQGFECGLTSNAMLPLCTAMVCPSGFTLDQTGLCKQSSGGLDCALFGHPGKPRCICAAGMTLNDQGECILDQEPKCKLWGNSQLPLCQAQLAQATPGSCSSVIGADVPLPNSNIIRSIPLSSFSNEARLPGCESACMLDKDCVAITLRFESCILYSKDPGGPDGFYWASMDNKVYSRCAKPADITDVFIVNLGQGGYLSSKGISLGSVQDGGDSEKWIIKRAGSGWTIQDFNQKFLSAKPLGVVEFANVPGPSEIWQIFRTPQGSVVIRAHTQQYLSMDEEGTVLANKMNVGPTEQWFITNTKMFLTPSLSESAMPVAAPLISYTIAPGEPLPLPTSQPFFPSQISTFTNTMAGLVGTELGAVKPADIAPPTYIQSESLAPVLAPFAYSSFFDFSRPLYSPSLYEQPVNTQVSMQTSLYDQPSTSIPSSPLYNPMPLNSLNPNALPFYGDLPLNALYHSSMPYFNDLPVNALYPSSMPYFNDLPLNALYPSSMPYFNDLPLNALYPSKLPYFHDLPLGSTFYNDLPSWMFNDLSWIPKSIYPPVPAPFPVTRPLVPPGAIHYPSPSVDFNLQTYIPPHNIPNFFPSFDHWLNNLHSFLPSRILPPIYL